MVKHKRKKVWYIDKATLIAIITGASSTLISLLNLFSNR